MNEIVLDDIRIGIGQYFKFRENSSVHPVIGNSCLAPDNTAYVTFVNGTVKKEGENYTSFCTSKEHFISGLTAWIDAQKGNTLYWRKLPTLYLNDNGTYQIRARLCVGKKVNEVLDD